MSLPRMGLRLFLLLSLVTLLLFCGCAGHNKDSGPRIVSTAEMKNPLESLPERSVAPRRSSRGSSSRLAPKGWYPPRSIEHHWQSIVIHHSGTANGNMAIFDKWHREGNHWDGVGYDFVIGNGTDSPDGLVEVTFRWDQQITGAHCKTPGNWANENAVGICLVGNFDESSPSDAQMRSLAQLVQHLSRRYRIPAHLIYGHNSTPGALVTNCPGRHFELRSIRAMLGK